MTSNEGFSVVAPMRVTSPSSTNGSTTSCWALLKRWISSMNRTVRSPVARRSSRASSMTRRRSATPADTAESPTNRAFARRAAIAARVVFPVPGGPQRIIDGSCPASIALRSTRPSPTRCG